MKKRFYILIYFSLCTIIASAQIQRNILDFTLGVTTKTQVLNYIKSHHYNYSINADGNFVVEKIKFAGQIWPIAFFSFYKGIFYDISFHNSDGDTPKETLDIKWNRLDYSLKRKYSGYIIESKNNSYIYSDNKTQVWSKYEYFNGRWALSLIYYDIQLSQQKIQSEEDEL